MGIEQQISEDLSSKIELDALITLEEKNALKEALKTDTATVIALSQLQEWEMRNFIIQEYAQLSYNLVGKRGVKAFQKALGIKEDGVYGPQTFEKIVTYQVQNGLTVDGIIGPETLGKIQWTPRHQRQSSETETPVPENQTQTPQRESIQYNFDVEKAIEKLDAAYSAWQKRTIAKLLGVRSNASSEDIVKAIAVFQHVTGKPLKVSGRLDIPTYEALQAAQNLPYDTPMNDKDVAKTNTKLRTAEKTENLDIPRKWELIFKEFFLHAKNKQEQKEILSGKYPIALTDTRTGKWLIIMGKNTLEFPVSYSRNGKFAKWPTQGDNAVNYGFIEHFTQGLPYSRGGMKVQVREQEAGGTGSLKWWHAAVWNWENGLRKTIGCKWLPPDVAVTLAWYVNKTGKWFWYASRA